MPAASPTKVWITGSGGLIGNYLAQTAPLHAPDWQVRSLTRNQLDLAEPTAVRRAYDADRPDLVIHCAALSKTPACQRDPALARRLNVEVTRQLADLAREARLILFSTDLVFDGRAGNYDEAATPNPLNVYAETKAEAERIVLANPRHTVIRTSLNGGQSPTRDRGFNEEIEALWAAGKSLAFFVDEFRCPIPAVVTARAVWELARRGATGLFHLAGAERLSRHQIAQLLAARHPELQPRVEAGSLRDYSGPPRAADTTMNCAKAQHQLSFPLPRFSEWLALNPQEPI